MIRQFLLGNPAQQNAGEELRRLRPARLRHTGWTEGDEMVYSEAIDTIRPLRLRQAFVGIVACGALIIGGNQVINSGGDKAHDRGPVHTLTSPDQAPHDD